LTTPALRKTKQPIITVRDANNTYTASCDGEKATATASAEAAAKRLIKREFGFDANEISLVNIGDTRPGYSRFNFSVNTEQKRSA